MLTINIKKIIILSLLTTGVVSCGGGGESTPSIVTPMVASKQIVDAPRRSELPAIGKPVVYQVLTRLFGNKKTTNKPWGTLAENGVGKFNDFDDSALHAIKDKGVTHIWYTGILHHALVNDYTANGISLDDADVVKGRAGSPYAIKDYYNVNPDLAVDVNNRFAEFEALIARTHSHGMKVIIDIVPNHVARHYQSLNKPKGVVDFGAQDNKEVEYARDNNFYYVIGEDFKVPQAKNGYLPLGGDNDQSIDGKFDESPAKWTGNGSRLAQPDANDWYETVKINYGVKPDGSYDFPTLPEKYKNLPYQDHYAFWQDKKVPNSWLKFKEITQFWLSKGVDGFRYDVAELVPVEFWSYLNSTIKTTNPEAVTIAEVYNPKMYRDFIHLGKMDYLYDKVGFYDTLKGIMQGKVDASELHKVQGEVLDIEEYMIHFLENHDEQRIASPDFVGDANIGKPAMVASTLISRAPTMLYFGQDVGEPGALNSGFGTATRTTIFDYAGVPAHQRWMNEGAFDGGKSTESEKALIDFYRRLMSLSSMSSIAKGKYAPLNISLKADTLTQTETKLKADNAFSLFAFTRWFEGERVIVVNQFANTPEDAIIEVPAELISAWQLADGEYPLQDVLASNAASGNALDGTDSQENATSTLKVTNGKGVVSITITPLNSLVLLVSF